MKYNIDKTKVGERIFNIRNRLNLTLEQFGKDKNINAERSNVSKWERGATLPNRSRLEVIAKKGNMTVNELLYGDVKEFINNNFYELLKIASTPVFINERFSNSNKSDLEYLFFEKYRNGKEIKFNIAYIQELFTECYYEYLNKCKVSLHINLKIIEENIELAQHYYRHYIVGTAPRSSYLEFLFKPFYENKDTFSPFNEEPEEIKNAKSLSFIIDKVKNNIEPRDIFIYSGILKELIFSMNKDDYFNPDEIDMLFKSHKIELLNLDTFIYHLDIICGCPTGEPYDIPLKINKYSFLNYENLYGIYIKKIETTYILANYIDFTLHYKDDDFIEIKKEYYTKVTNPEIIKTFNNINQLELNEKMSQLNNKFALVPLNTEAEYFILNHDNTYQITKITEIPDCKYIAPIIGRLE